MEQEVEDSVRLHMLPAMACHPDSSRRALSTCSMSNSLAVGRPTSIALSPKGPVKAARAESGETK